MAIDAYIILAHVTGIVVGAWSVYWLYGAKVDRLSRFVSELEKRRGD